MTIQAVSIHSRNLSNTFSCFCSLLKLKPHQIRTITILNPIDLSEEIDGKAFILDINIELNNDTYINLEMQVANKHNWQERSLSYLCRRYDQLYQGQEYEEAKPVYHIGFLDYTLFPDKPEFYSTYKMMNVKNHHVYSDKLVLSVVDLSKIGLATKEDEDCGLAYWARLFKAKTWEELNMLSNQNDYLEEAAKSIYIANADEIVRQKCRAREEAERHERTVARDMRKLKEENAQLTSDNVQLTSDNAQLTSDNVQLTSDNNRLKNQILDMETRMDALIAMVEQLQKQVTKEEA